ncbi:TadE/TadG family type IV pilus assembly protein [Sphingomonas qilianensis]|uniref:Pilus assembly protein n=1 Tax=Sphingomonas qilianensis TaxID=1736690 RepID=A0ABU9XRW5_9SPHN
MISHVSARAKKFCADNRGLALVEFALAAPVLITLGLAGAEVTNMAVSVMRVNQISTAISDNVARVRDSIDEADVNEALLSAKTIGASLNFTARGRVIVSSVEPNAATDATGQYIRWQRCTGTLNVPASQPQYGAQGKGQNDATLPYMGPTGRRIVAGQGSALIFVEVTYRYQPLVTAELFGTPIIRSESVYNVRERSSQVLGTAPGTTASLCSTYAA